MGAAAIGAEKENKSMPSYAFYQPISLERAPQGHRCEWCNKLAAHQLIAIGGTHHNQAGFFCHECGEAFVHAVNRSTRKLVTTEGL